MKVKDLNVLKIVFDFRIVAADEIPQSTILCCGRFTLTYHCRKKETVEKVKFQKLLGNFLEKQVLLLLLLLLLRDQSEKRHITLSNMESK